MAWGFRKSKTIGGVRFTVSKSGISTSVGGKGFRLTSGPRGVYVTTGLGGFYYRQRLDTPPRYRPAADTRPPGGTVEAFASAAAERLTDIGQQGFVDALNDATTRGALQLTTALAGAALIGILLLSNVGQHLVAEAAAYAFVAFITAWWIENRRRRFVVLYDLSDDAADRYEQLRQALEGLAASGCLRGVKLKVTHGDWKPNAGATRSLEFERAWIGPECPPHIVTNIPVLALHSQAKRLYFLPDRVLVREGRRFGAISYEALAAGTATSTFIWDEPLPRDAQVVGHSWLYVRRD